MPSKWISDTQDSSALLMRKKPNPILVADPDAAFIESLFCDPQAKFIPPIVVENGKEAQQVLAQFKQPFSGVFINSGLMNPHAVSVVRSSHHYQPAVPIFFLSDTPAGSSEELAEADLKNLGIQKILHKPITYAELLKLVNPAVAIFDPNEALEISKLNEDALDAEVTVKDTAFFSTRAETFLSGTKTFFDVYVRLQSGRYVMILRGGDSFSVDRVMNYLKKGVTHFYLRKEAQEQYLNYCDKLVSAIVKSPKVPTSIKISQTFKHGEETVDFLRTRGLSTESIEYACGFVGNVEVLVNELHLKKNEAIKPLLDDLSEYDHGVGTAFIASLLIKALEVENERAVHTVGIGSLLHDIGLHSLPVAFRNEDMSTMTEAEKKTFCLHPTTGAKVLQLVPGIDPVVPQIVEQHHERRTRSGFPKQLGSGSILRFAEIVGISDEFFRLIQKKRTDPNMDPYVAMLNEFDGFSLQVVQAFQAVFGTPT